MESIVGSVVVYHLFDVSFFFCSYLFKCLNEREMGNGELQRSNWEWRELDLVTVN